MKKYISNKAVLMTVLIVVTMLLFTGCAASVNVEECVVNQPYGFWGGLWHGIIAPFSFLLSLLDQSVSMYAVHNNGGFYDLGFVLGSGILAKIIF